MIFPTFFPSNASPPSFVLDASVTVAWAVASASTIYSVQVQHKLLSSVVVAPALWSIDVGERLRTTVRHKKTPQTACDLLFGLLAVVQIYVDDEGPFRVWPAMLDLARAHALSVREAAYLELALRTNLPLATTDATLTRAANAASIPIFTP